MTDPRSRAGQFEEFECVNCAVLFGLPVGYADRRRADGHSFFCPNGHSMSYKETEADKIRRERDRLKQQAARLETEAAASLAARIAAEVRAEVAERKAKRLVARAKAGVCPCCNRTFVELSRHMKTKHPAFDGDVIPLRKKAKP